MYRQHLIMVALLFWQMNPCPHLMCRLLLRGFEVDEHRSRPRQTYDNSLVLLRCRINIDQCCDLAMALDWMMLSNISRSSAHARRSVTLTNELSCELFDTTISRLLLIEIFDISVHKGWNWYLLLLLPIRRSGSTKTKNNTLFTALFILTYLIIRCVFSPLFLLPFSF
jgi:hypothetical protein